ncbi:MAG: hypothetical protein ACLQBY_13590 [Solirubrobacteraceae bacterium]
MGVHYRNFETPDPQRLERRARDAASAADGADRTVRSVLGHLTQALASDRDHTALVEAAGFAAQADDSASSAVAAARDATTAARGGNAEQLDKLADVAQGHAADARVAADHALHLIPPA